MKLKFTVILKIILAVLISSLCAQSSHAESICWNRGVFEKEKIDRKESRYFSGDIRSIKAVFDYDRNKITGKLIWNTFPSSSNTTRLNFGFLQNTGDCVSVSEEFQMKGRSKKFLRNREEVPSDYSRDMLGTLKVSHWSKNSFSFSWTMSDLDFEMNHIMGESCVSVGTLKKGTWYKSSTTCVTTGNVTNCDGPGWVSGFEEFENVTVWARSHWDDIPSSCTYKEDDLSSP